MSLACLVLAVVVWMTTETRGTSANVALALLCISLVAAAVLIEVLA